MSKCQITENALTISIKELMKTIPLSKISVQEIVDNCGLNRRTFYYHFKDKFDLVNWIYYTEVMDIIGNSKSYENWCDGMYKTLLYLSNNKSFYINALNTPGQNAFNEYFFDITFDLIMGVITDLSSDMNISLVDKKFIVDFYTYAFVGITVQWIKDGMKLSPEVIICKLNEIVDGSMLDALSRYDTDALI